MFHVNLCITGFSPVKTTTIGAQEVSDQALSSPERIWDIFIDDGVFVFCFFVFFTKWNQFLVTWTLASTNTQLFVSSSSLINQTSPCPAHTNVSRGSQEREEKTATASWEDGCVCKLVDAEDAAGDSFSRMSVYVTPVNYIGAVQWGNYIFGICVGTGRHTLWDRNPLETLTSPAWTRVWLKFIHRDIRPKYRPSPFYSCCWSKSFARVWGSATVSSSTSSSFVTIIHELMVSPLKHATSHLLTGARFTQVCLDSTYTWMLLTAHLQPELWTVTEPAVVWGQHHDGQKALFSYFITLLTLIVD